MAEKLQESVWPRQGSHLEEVGAKCAQQQEPVRGFDAGKDDVSSHEFRESTCIADITAICYGGPQGSPLDHECGTGKIGEQGVAVPLDL